MIVFKKKICNGYTWCTLYLYFCLLFKFTCIYWSRYCSKNTFCNHHIPVVFSNFNLAYFQSVSEWLRLEAWVFFLYFCYKKKYTHVPSVKFWIWKVPFNTHCELCLSLLDFALGNHGWWNVGQCRSKWCRLNNADSSYLTIYVNLTCLRAEIPVNHVIS